MTGKGTHGGLLLGLKQPAHTCHIPLAKTLRVDVTSEKVWNH